MWVKNQEDYVNLDKYTRLNVGQHSSNGLWYIYGGLTPTDSLRLNGFQYGTEEEAVEVLEALIQMSGLIKLNVQEKISPERAEALKPPSSGKIERKNGSIR